MSKYLAAEIKLDSHDMSILAAYGGFEPSVSVLPERVRHDEPLGLRLAFNLERSKHCNVYDSRYWNLLYCKWIWHFALDSIVLLCTGGNRTRATLENFGPAQPQMLIYESGNLTIEDLLDRKITESQTVHIKFEMAYLWHVDWDKYLCIPIIPGCLWDYWGSGSYSPPNLDEQIIDTFDYYVDVEVPPPPPPDLIFDLDYCWLSKTTVAPNEKFTINVKIKETIGAAGPYSIESLCEGKEQTLGSGTIAAHGTKSHSFTVTANQLAQREITSSQYLSFNIDVYNNAGRTDRWPPPAIAVIVEITGEEATLSGRVTDKTTGVGISNVSVSTVGRTVYTNTTGNYSIDNLKPGFYTIGFKKSGYYDETKGKTLVAGSNTLSVAMTAVTEPPPVEVPWGKIVAGGLAVAAVSLILTGKKNEVKK